MILLTRLELYELVWSYPLKLLAEEFQIKPVKLANTCDAYGIARPPAGYWQKLEHGKPVERPALTGHALRFDEIVTIRVQSQPSEAAPKRIE